MTIRSSAPVDLFREADLSWCPSAHSCSCSLKSAAVLIESLFLTYYVIQDISKNEKVVFHCSHKNKNKIYGELSSDINMCLMKFRAMVYNHLNEKFLQWCCCLSSSLHMTKYDREENLISSWSHWWDFCLTDNLLKKVSLKNRRSHAYSCFIPLLMWHDSPIV